MTKKILALLFLPMLCFSADKTPEPQGALSFQIIQQQLNFDAQTIKNATILEGQNKVFKGLLIELKDPASLALAGMTGTSIGKTANVVLDNKIVASSVIQTVLSGKILISGIKREEAELVIASLNKRKFVAP